MLAFSGTFPATVLALDGLDADLVTFGRATAAGVLAVAALLLARAARPSRRQWPALIMVGLGVVVGAPLLWTIALDIGASSTHAAVVTGLLPAATAMLAVARAGERPSAVFWAAGAAGAGCVVWFTLTRGAGRFTLADLLLFAALIAAAVGYTEGGRLAREMPGWQVISWALVCTLPLSTPLSVWLLITTDQQWTARSVAGMGYVSVISMYLGFFAWYAGLGRAGVARASQLQLVQPLLTVTWSALLLGEVLDVATVFTAAAVLACVALTQRARIGSAHDPAAEASVPVGDAGRTGVREALRETVPERTMRMPRHDEVPVRSEACQTPPAAPTR